MKTRRIEWLDLVRGVAAIAVVLTHMGLWADYLGTRLSVRFYGALGALAVDLFFALSGIVLALKYTAAIEGGSSFLEFAGARWRRLYPMVLVAASFVAVLNALGVPATDLAPDRFGWLLFLVLPLPRHWPQPFSFPADVAMWSLWAELMANAVWFVVLKAGRRWLMPVTVLCLAAHAFVIGKDGVLWDGFQQGALMMTVGLVRALAWFNLGFYIAHSSRRPMLTAAQSALAFAACLAAVGWLADTRWAVPIQVLTMLVGLLLLHALLHAAPPPARLAPVARWLGMLSYPIYLVHVPTTRLLHYVDGVLGHWGAVIVVIGGVATLVTVANEAIVDRLQHWHRMRRSRAAATVIPG